jgi:hypothetical protein
MLMYGECARAIQNDEGEVTGESAPRVINPQFCVTLGVISAAAQRMSNIAMWVLIIN